MTHLDAFRLERADLMSAMSSHPKAALHVADTMYSMLPHKRAKQVIDEIYLGAGLRDLLELRSVRGAHTATAPPSNLSHVYWARSRGQRTISALSRAECTISALSRAERVALNTHSSSALLSALR